MSIFKLADGFEVLFGGHGHAERRSESGLSMRDEMTAEVSDHRLNTVTIARQGVENYYRLLHLADREVRSAWQNPANDIQAYQTELVSQYPQQPAKASQRMGSYTLEAASNQNDKNNQAPAAPPSAADFKQLMEGAGLSEQEARQMEQRAFDAAKNYPTEPNLDTSYHTVARNIDPNRFAAPKQVQVERSQHDYIETAFTVGSESVAGERPDNNPVMANDARDKLKYAAADGGEVTI